MRTYARTWLVPAAFGLALTCIAPLAAQWEPWPMKNVPRLANGKVDMKHRRAARPTARLISRASGCPPIR